MKHSFGRSKSAVLADSEYLYDHIVPAGRQKKSSVVSDHEIPWMSSRMHITGLVQGSVLIDVEYRDSVVLKTVRCIQPFSGRMDVYVRTTSRIHLISLDLLDKPEFL